MNGIFIIIIIRINTNERNLWGRKCFGNKNVCFHVKNSKKKGTHFETPFIVSCDIFVNLKTYQSKRTPRNLKRKYSGDRFVNVHKRFIHVSIQKANYRFVSFLETFNDFLLYTMLPFEIFSTRFCFVSNLTESIQLFYKKKSLILHGKSA